MKDIKIPSREITLFVHYARRVVVFDSGQYGVGHTYGMFTAVRHVYARRDPVVHVRKFAVSFGLFMRASVRITVFSPSPFPGDDYYGHV